jgi:hypothetical protein
VQNLLVGLVFLGLSPLAPHAFTALPDNPIAVANCTAKVKVDAARVRSGPSLDSRILGVRIQDEPLYVTKVEGKWAQVILPDGDSAYMATYLLAFPANEILEQWKRETPSPSVGKKARVKWAKVNFRKYPSVAASRLGHFLAGDEVSVLAALGNGWSLVQSRNADDGSDCFGFIADRALTAPAAPDAWDWAMPLARVRLDPGETVEVEPAAESPAEYCRRTAWTPELFELELTAKSRTSGQPESVPVDPAGPAPAGLVASR